eukprot:EG_transcript_17691
MGEALLPPQAAQPGTTASAPRGGWPRSLAAGLSLAALVPLLLGLGPGVSTGAAGSGAVHLYHLTPSKPATSWEAPSGSQPNKDVLAPKAGTEAAEADPGTPAPNQSMEAPVVLPTPLSRTGPLNPSGGQAAVPAELVRAYMAGQITKVLVNGKEVRVQDVVGSKSWDNVMTNDVEIFVDSHPVRSAILAALMNLLLPLGFVAGLFYLSIWGNDDAADCQDVTLDDGQHIEMELL